MVESLIEHPLYLVLALVVVIITIGTVAGISLIGASASAGLISMNATISSFMPLFGVGLSIGLTIAFISLVKRFKHA